MKSILIQIEMFKANRLFSNEKQYIDSMNEYDEICTSQDVERILPLLYLIDDNSEHSEITQVFVDGIFSFYEDNVYRFLQIILSNLTILKPHALEWMEIFVLRITNTEQNRKIIQELFSSISSENKYLFKNTYMNLTKRYNLLPDWCNNLK